ncbi:MAG TPA: hypothetical protein VHR39_04835 [Propionibacteriaceae bacterium]|nr:hypothetical protein [Propionibacteriaceae bacterium]
MSALLTRSEELGISRHPETDDAVKSGRWRAGNGSIRNEGRREPAPGTEELSAHATRVAETR